MHRGSLRRLLINIFRNWQLHSPRELQMQKSRGRREERAVSYGSKLSMRPRWTLPDCNQWAEDYDPAEESRSAEEEQSRTEDGSWRNDGSESASTTVTGFFTDDPLTFRWRHGFKFPNGLSFASSVSCELADLPRRTRLRSFFLAHEETTARFKDDTRWYLY